MQALRLGAIQQPERIALRSGDRHGQYLLAVLQQADGAGVIVRRRQDRAVDDQILPQPDHFAIGLGEHRRRRRHLLGGTVHTCCNGHISGAQITAQPGEIVRGDVAPVGQDHQAVDRCPMQAVLGNSRIEVGRTGTGG